MVRMHVVHTGGQVVTRRRARLLQCPHRVGTQVHRLVDGFVVGVVLTQQLSAFVVNVVSRTSGYYGRWAGLADPQLQPVVQVSHRTTSRAGTAHAPAVTVGVAVDAIVGDMAGRVVLDDKSSTHVLRLRHPVAGWIDGVGVGGCTHHLLGAVAGGVVVVLGGAARQVGVEQTVQVVVAKGLVQACLLYTSPSPRD